MDICITPAKLSGNIGAISSKSDVHRLLICAALADSPTDILFNTKSKDIAATLSCITELDAVCSDIEGGVRVAPGMQAEDVSCKSAILDCNESGSTLRFLIPVAAVACKDSYFYGAGRLAQRPLTPLLDQMSQHGCVFEMPPFDLIGEAPSSGEPLLRVKGKLQGGVFTLPGNVSSQFVSGLLFALPMLSSDSEIVILPPAESVGYIDMTLSSMKRFGITIQCRIEDSGKRRYIIKGNQRYRSPGVVNAEGDWSNAAFWLTANALGSSVDCDGLDQQSMQADKQIISLLQQLVQGDKERQIDASQIPDLVPILAVAATVTPGTTLIVNAARLRIKESDRLFAVSKTLNILGADVQELSDGLVIEGRDMLSGGMVDGFNDHRIVMAAAIAATVCKGAVTICGAQAADKSYPGFFEDYTRLGGRIDVL